MKPTEDREAMLTARAALIARLRSQAVITIGPWTRDELYVREPKREDDAAANPEA